MSTPTRPDTASERVPDAMGDDEGEELALDDDIGLPALDGEVAGEDVPGDDGLDVGEDERVGLDDAAAEDAAEAIVDPLADVEAESWETGEDDPLEDEDELAEGEGQPWTDGSEDAESIPLDVDDVDEAGVGDAGEEGIEDDGGELELPPRPPESADEDYPDDLELG